jgi:hypothetical protein
VSGAVAGKAVRMSANFALRAAFHADNRMDNDALNY